MKVRRSRLTILKALGHSTLAMSFALSLTVSPHSALAKDHPYNAAFESQVESLFFDNGKPSNMKIDGYIARLTTKRQELAGLLVNAEVDKKKLKGKEPKLDEIKKDAADDKLVMALDNALSDLKAMKSTASKAELLTLAYNVLDLEANVRILGPTASIIGYLKDYLKAWTVPLNSTPDEEASNLKSSDGSHFLSPNEIAQSKQNGSDLSKLNPPAVTEFWEQPTNIAKTDVVKASLGQTMKFYEGSDVEFPADNVYFFDDVKHSDTKPKLDSYVLNKKGKKIKFKLKFGAEIHAEPTAAAIMMTLGFPSDITKFEPRIKLILGKTKLSELKRDWEVYYKRDLPRGRYLIENSIVEEGKDEKLGNFVIMRNAMIEARPKGISRLGGWQAGDFSQGSFRDVRGLIFLQLFFDNADYQEFKNVKTFSHDKDGVIDRKMHVISDLGSAFGRVISEKPDLYRSTMVASRNNDAIKMQYRSIVPADLKNKMSYADVKWVTRLLAQMTREQFVQATQIGGWPSCVADIYVEKMISRRNDLVSNFGLVGERLPNGEIISLMPAKTGDAVNYQLVCDDKKIKGETKTDYIFGITDILTTAGRISGDIAIDLSRAAANSIKQTRIEPAQVKTTPGFGIKPSLGPVVELITSFPRTIERNPTPESEQDLYIVKDEFELGLRLGVAYGVYKDAVISRRFAISYPVRSMDEARKANGFIVNPLLPLQLRKGDVPAKYVLKAETFLSSGTGIELINFHSPLASPGIKIGKDRVLLGRSVLDARDKDQVLLFRDQAKYTQSVMELFARIGIFKLPIFKAMSGAGSSEGRAVVLKRDAVERDSKVGDQLAAAVANGDFSPFEKAEQKLALSNDFKFKRKGWSLLLWKGRSEQTFDHLRLTEADSSKEKIQLRSTRTNSASLLNKNSNSLEIEISGESSNKSAKKVSVKTISTDIDTTDEHLDTILGFINGTSLNGKKIIEFTPSLGYSVNKKYGKTIAETEVEIYEQGLTNIMKMTESDLWSALASRLGVTKQQMASEIAEYKESAPGESMLPKDRVSLIDHARDVLSEIKKIAKTSTAEKSYDRVAKLFRKALYRVKVSYEPRLLAALLQVAGPANVYSRHIVGPPAFAEVNLLGEVPLVGEQGTRRGDGSDFIMVSPQTPLDLFYMFDSWF